jgi:hypothetical protein
VPVVVNGGNRSFAESPVQPLSLTSSAFQKTIAFFHAYKTPPQRYGSVHCPLNHVQHSVRRYSSSASASAVDPHQRGMAEGYEWLSPSHLSWPCCAMLCDPIPSHPHPIHNRHAIRDTLGSADPLAGFHFRAIITAASRQ